MDRQAAKTGVTYEEHLDALVTTSNRWWSDVCEFMDWIKDESQEHPDPVDFYDRTMQLSRWCDAGPSTIDPMPLLEIGGQIEARTLTMCDGSTPPNWQPIDVMEAAQARSHHVVERIWNYAFEEYRNSRRETQFPKYSKPHPPKFWREVYAKDGVPISLDTFAEMRKDGRIRAISDTSKKVRIDVRDLPPEYSER